MNDLSDWLETQSFADLARYAKKPTEELRQVIVTETMVDAAMGYFSALYDADLNTQVLEDLFRIMAVLQPKGPAVLRSLL